MKKTAKLKPKIYSEPYWIVPEDKKNLIGKPTLIKSVPIGSHILYGPCAHYPGGSGVLVKVNRKTFVYETVYMDKTVMTLTHRFDNLANLFASFMDPDGVTRVHPVDYTTGRE